MISLTTSRCQLTSCISLNEGYTRIHCHKICLNLSSTSDTEQVRRMNTVSDNKVRSMMDVMCVKLDFQVREMLLSPNESKNGLPRLPEQVRTKVSPRCFCGTQIASLEICNGWLSPLTFVHQNHLSYDF